LRTFTRQELYDLVWAEPMRSLAQRFSISDRGLAKICAAGNIPVPSRGYWAKLEAGKKVERWALPPRTFGQSQNVRIGRNDWQSGRESDAEIMNSPIPPPPMFEPEMDVVEAQVAALVHKAPLPRGDSHGWHSQIEKHLVADEERLRKKNASPYPMSWDGPVLDTPFEKRRLAILNALFVCLTRCGVKPSLSGKYAREISVVVGTTAVPLTLDSRGAAKLIERERYGDAFRPRDEKDGLRLALGSPWSSKPPSQSWEDKRGQRLERQLRKIATAIVVEAERRLRAALTEAHASRVEYREQLFEAERKRRAEEERQRRARQAKLEKARVDSLIGQAHALEEARQIRAYVTAVRELNATASEPMTAEELESWSGWALAQAERIDPVLSGAYKSRIAESEE